MPAKCTHTVIVSPAPAKANHPEKHQVTCSDFPSTDQVVATNAPSPSTSIARFFDGDLRDIKLSKVRLGRFKVSFRGLNSAVTTAVLLEHDFHIKKEVSHCHSSALTFFRPPLGLKKPPPTPSWPVTILAKNNIKHTSVMHWKIWTPTCAICQTCALPKMDSSLWRRQRICQLPMAPL